MQLFVLDTSICTCIMKSTISPLETTYIYVWYLKDSCGPSSLPIGVPPSRLLWLVGPYSALPGAIGLPLYGEEKVLKLFRGHAEVQVERCSAEDTSMPVVPFNVYFSISRAVRRQLLFSSMLRHSEKIVESLGRSWQFVSAKTTGFATPE